MDGQLTEDQKKGIEADLQKVMNTIAYNTGDDRMTQQQVLDLCRDIKRNLTRIEQKVSHKTLGVLQLGGYEDPGFALGDAGNKYSYGCDVIYQEVEGLTFALCQMGYKTPQGEQLRKAFNSIDTNKNGKLNHAELKQFFEVMGKDKTDEQIQEMIDKADTHDNDGKLNFDEFCAASHFIMPPIKDAFADAVKKLEDKGVAAITADCGFFVQFNEMARSVATVPCMLSSVCQIPQVELIIDKKDKFVIFTANSKSFDKPEMEAIMKKLGSRGENADYTNEGDKSRIVIVGIEDMPGVEAINEGTKEDVQLIGDGILKKMENALKENPEITAILLECTMMGPYANRLRERFHLPVFDCITAADTLLNSLRRHDRLCFEDNSGADWTK